MGYETMSVEELIAENQRLIRERDRIKNEQRKITIIIDQKCSQESAMQKYNAMSDAEKEVLNQVISNAGGIYSEEKIGEINKDK